MKFVYDPKLRTMVPENYLSKLDQPQEDWQKDLWNWLTKQIADSYNYSTRSIAYEFKRVYPQYENIPLDKIRNEVAKRINVILSSTEDMASGPAAPAGGIGAPLAPTGAVNAISSPILKKDKKGHSRAPKKRTGVAENISSTQPEELHRILDILIEDEREAIKGYDDAKKVFSESSVLAGNIARSILDCFEHIRKEEEEHIRELESLRDLLKSAARDSALYESADRLISPQKNRKMPIVGMDGILGVAAESTEEEGDEGIPEEAKGGDCFRQAWRNFYSNLGSNPPPLLVHGIVTGQGAIEGLQFCHAWIEIGDVVIDTTIPLFAGGVPRQMYYSMARLDEKNLFKYNREQVAENAVKYKTYGPWEDILWEIEEKSRRNFTGGGHRTRTKKGR
jgi:hypothetical protein